MRTSTKLYVFVTTLIIGVICLLPGFKNNGSSLKESLPKVIDFNFHVRPIISDRCFKCHGPDKNKREAELALNTEEGLYKALREHPERFVIVPGKPKESELYLRISSKDTSYQMPPPESNLSLSEFEIEILKKWIEQGAKYKKHWAYIKPEKEELPAVKMKNWTKNEVDYFILEKLESKGLEPNPEAGKERLLRRLSYDLTGLPPSLELLDKFLADNSADAFEKIVDELLAQPGYGEKMAANWMDVARYADSHGYQDDSYRSMWPWRDWVIHAFNKNMPYDQFITWQLAGDLLPDATKEQILATGFCRNHKITQEGGVIEEEYRIEYIADKSNTYGKALLGLTTECARCHDHKYDPISQEEYYQTFAFFNQSNEKGFYGDVSNASIAEQPVIVPTKEELAGILKFINSQEADTVVSMVMQEVDTPRATFVLKRGQYDLPTVQVPFGVPEAIAPFPDDLPKNRLGLAKWTFLPGNPLTARVYVNRIWQEIFGTGIVKTPDNFGSQGELPSHPALLDWLAVDFLENGWDVKRLIKKIVTSATYRQSSAVTKKKLEIDPENRLLSRGPRYRLSPEEIRDTWLATSGLLNKKIGGPSVKTYQPVGLWEDTNPGEGRGSLTKYVQDTGDKLYRRSLYTFFKKTMPHPYMVNFDASYRDNCTVQRQRTNTPLQALNAMNDPQMLEASRFFATRLMKDKSAGVPQMINVVFRICLSRNAATIEMELLQSLYNRRKMELTGKEDEARKLLTVGDSDIDKSVNPVECAALMEVIQLIFNMDETICKS